MDSVELIRAVRYGVAAYLLSIVFTPAAYLLVDLSRPLPLTLGGV